MASRCDRHVIAARYRCGVPSPPFVTLPDGVRPVWVESERGTFAGLAASPTYGSGRTALLVPGYTGSKENLIAVLRPLAEAGHRVVAVDMRGQYETPGPDDPSAYTTAALGADVAAIVDVLEAGPVHLLGHSLGGLAAREAALARPSRLASLTLLDSGPAALGGPQAERARQLVAALQSTGVDEVWEAMEALNAQDPAMADRTPEIIDFQRRRFLDTSAAGMIAMAGTLLTESDRVEELASGVTCPILVAYGEDDAHWTTEEQAKMAERLGARRAVIPGVGHSPAADAPEETARILAEFWAAAERPEES